MPRLTGTALALLAGCAVLPAQRLVFTMRTHPNCPVVISSVTSSKDFGFQSLKLFNDSPNAIDSMMLTVVLTVGSREEVVDGGRVFARLGSGERKSVDAFLGRLDGLRQRAQELRLAEARAIIFVDSVDFTDGSQWEGREPVVEIPLEPGPVRPAPPR